MKGEMDVNTINNAMCEFRFSLYGLCFSRAFYHVASRRKRRKFAHRVSIHNKYPPEIFTGDPGECDLLVGFSLLDALCFHSVRINALVHIIMETWKVQSPEEKWKRAIAW
jgi:hypothetical protein